MIMEEKVDPAEELIKIKRNSIGVGQKIHLLGEEFD